MHLKVLETGIGLFVVTAVLQGGLVGSRSLPELEQNADLIVVGSATADILVGAATATFPLHVSRVLKGDPATDGMTISVSWVDASGLLTAAMAPHGTHVTSTGTGLWFLHYSSNTWHLLPVMTGGITFNEVYYPVPVGPIASAYAYATTVSLSDKIASELAAALEADHANSVTLDSLNYSLDELNSPVLQIFYQRMSMSASMKQKILGLSGLVRSGNATALSSAALIAPQFEAYPREASILLHSIQHEFRATDTNSIEVLGQAAVDSTNPSLSFREASAHALASIHTLPSLPYLVALLDDSDEKLRFEAVGGVGSFANGLPVQTTANTPNLASLQLEGNAPYRTEETIANFARGEQAISQNEVAYLKFWKNWWTTHRASLGY